MKRGFSLGLLLLSLCLLSTTIVPTSAADYTKVGVKVGDTAEYNISGSSNGQARMEIQQIVGTNVTLVFTDLGSGNTGLPVLNITGDIAKGSGGIYVYLIVANLSQGDSVFSGAPQGFAIDWTGNMTILGVTRAVNHFGINMGSSLIISVYWDRATGLAVKIDETLSSLHFVFDMISTTAFATRGVDPVVLLAIGGGIAGVVALVIVVSVVAKRRKAAQ